MQIFFSDFLLLLFYFCVLSMPCNMWDLSSLTRDQISGPCIGSTESEPLDCQVSLWVFFFFFLRGRMKRLGLIIIF